MPQAIAIPLITAGLPALGQLAGAVIGSHSQKNAADTQAKSAQAAIDYQKQVEADRKSRYDAAYADYRTRYDAWLNRFYGGKGDTSVPLEGQGQTLTPGVLPALGSKSFYLNPANDPSKVGTTTAAVPPVAQGKSLADFMGNSGTPVPQVAMGTGTPVPQTGSLADVGDWSNWKRYGVGA